MRIVTGYITLFCFLMLAVKYPLRKLGLTKANQFMMKLHEIASAALVLVGTAHLVMACLVFSQYSLLLTLSGITVYVLCFVIITACHLTKDVKVKMHWHRILSLAAAIAIAVHVTAYFV